MSNAVAVGTVPVGQAEIPNTLFWKCCRIVTYFICVNFFDYKAFGVKNVPRHGGALLVSNHQSYLDPVLLGTKLPRQLSYMAKSELFTNRFFCWLITKLGAFPVKQGKTDKGAIDETVRRLREGHLLNLFPEGARTFDGAIGPIQRGSALVVRKAGVPIVPAVIDGSFDAWPRTTKMFRLHPIRVLYGKPLHVEGLKSEAIIKLIEHTLHEMLIDLRAGDVRKYER